MLCNGRWRACRQNRGHVRPHRGHPGRVTPRRRQWGLYALPAIYRCVSHWQRSPWETHRYIAAESPGRRGAHPTVRTFHTLGRARHSVRAGGLRRARSDAPYLAAAGPGSIGQMPPGPSDSAHAIGQSSGVLHGMLCNMPSAGVPPFFSSVCTKNIYYEGTCKQRSHAVSVFGGVHCFSLPRSDVFICSIMVNLR